MKGTGISATVSLTHLATNNKGRTLPLTAAERDQYDQMVSNGATDQELEAAFLPRPARTLESREWRLDGKLELPVNDQHFAVLGTQVIRGELEDGVLGLVAAGFPTTTCGPCLPRITGPRWTLLRLPPVSVTTTMKPLAINSAHAFMVFMN